MFFFFGAQNSGHYCPSGIPCRSAQPGGPGLSRAHARAIHLGDDADRSEPGLFGGRSLEKAHGGFLKQGYPNSWMVFIVGNPTKI